MSDITLKEAIKKKSELEIKIGDLLSQFTEETGLPIDGLDMGSVSLLSNMVGNYIISVNIKLTI